METSILNSIKLALGIPTEVDSFDAVIIMHINTVFVILNQLGVGPDTTFSISDSTTIWSDFTNNVNAIESVKTYVYLKVKSLFDPPSSTVVLECMNKQASELEWRLENFNV